MRYFDLFDDMSTDQRWYLDGPTGPNGEWLGVALISGRRYEGKVPLEVTIYRPGPHLELTMSLDTVPIVNERVAEIFSAHVGDDAQLIPTRAGESDEKLWAVNVLASPDCVDEARSGQVVRRTAEDGQPDRIGHYKIIVDLHLDLARAGNHAILRPWGWRVAVVVNETIAGALQKAGVRCRLKLAS